MGTERVCAQALGRDRHLARGHRHGVAQQSLRGVLCFCTSPLMNNVEAYIQFKPGLFTAEGEVTDQRTADFLRN